MHSRAFMTRIAFPIVLVGLILTAALPAQDLTATRTILDNGKDASQRPSPWLFNANSTAVTLITAPGPMLWDLPQTGNIYAAVPVPPGIELGQLLAGINIDTYNTVCPQSVFYEAPNHAYVIQSIPSGGVTNVGGEAARETGQGCVGTGERLSVPIEYGRRRLGIAIAAPDGKIVLGQTTPVVFSVPPGFPPAALRVDFGAKVMINGTTKAVFTAPGDFPIGAFPLTVNVVYPSDYQGMSIRLEGVATEGFFLSSVPLFASGTGLQATGAVVTGTNSFSAVQPPAADLTVTKTVNDQLIRRGEKVRYTYTVRNNAATDVSEVSVWDNKLGEIRRIPQLGAGAQAQATSSETELFRTTTNYAMATARDPFGKAISGRSDEVTVTVIDPAVSLAIWNTNATKVGVDVPLNYTVRNPGDVPLNGFTITDAADGWTQAFGVTLEPGQEFTHTRTLKITKAQAQRRGTVTATVPADGGTVTAQHSWEVDVLEPAINISVTADNMTPNPGDQVTYTVTVRNPGDDVLTGVTITGDKLGNIANVGQLDPGTPQVFTHTETLQQSVTHTITASGVDSWMATVQKSTTIDITVIYPLLNVQVFANGNPQKITVNKGTDVVFTFSVTNTGNCPVTITSFMLDGVRVGSSATGELQPNASAALPQDQRQVNDSRLYKFTVTGKDPGGKVHTWADQVEVAISKGLLASLQSLIADAKSLIHELERLKTRFDAIYKEYYARLGMHANRGTDPCADPALRALLTEAASIHARIAELVVQLKDILKNEVVVAATGVEVMDFLDFAMHAAQTEPDVARRLAEMQQKWRGLGCGDSPDGKSDIVTIQIQVKDHTGGPIANAVVRCGTQQLVTGAGGACALTVPLNKNDEVTASAVTDIIPGYSVSGSGSATYRGGGALPIGIVINTDTRRSATLSGRVLDADGHPVPGATVSSGSGSDVTGADGSYSFSAAAELGKPLTVTASVRLADGSTATASSSVVYEGETQISVPTIKLGNVEVVEEAEITISGRVLDGNGVGLANAVVQAAGMSVTTDANGRYSGLGPITATLGRPLQVNASVALAGGSTVGGSTSITPTQAGGISARITISGAVTEEPFTVSGRVLDGNGKALDGAAVSIAGHWSGTTSGGSYRSAQIEVPVGTALAISASIKANDGNRYTGSTSVTYPGGSRVSASTIVIQGVETIDEDRTVTALSVTADKSTVDVGTSTVCSAIATLDDGSTVDVTGSATWSGATGGAFQADRKGSFNVGASYEGYSSNITITVKCPDGTDWSNELNKCSSLEEAIEETEPEDEGICDKTIAQQELVELKSTIALGEALRSAVESKHAFFMKAVGDQNSKVCNNNALAAAYSGALSNLQQYQALSDQVAKLIASMLWRYSVCPIPDKGGPSDATLEFTIAFSAKHHEAYAEITNRIAEIREQLNRFGCDEDEVRERGNTTAENTRDPKVTGDGGGGATEICGDGIDNDGDGLYDEDCEDQGNFNVTIILYDSGDAKDDVFGLSVSSQGNLGSTPAGGARTYPLSLPAGSYVATVAVISAPDDIGTFTVLIREGNTVLASESGGPGQGTVVGVPFTVSGAPTPTFAPDPINYQTVFYNEDAASRERLRQPDPNLDEEHDPARRSQQRFQR